VVRWRTPDGKSRSKTLKREVDAKRFLTTVGHSKDVGTYIDPGRSKITLRAWAEQWLAGQTYLKPSTRAKYDGISVGPHRAPLGRHSAVPCDACRRAEVDLLDLPGACDGALRPPRLLADMELAVRDKRIPSNPATGVRLPRVAKPEKRFLTVEELHRLADAAAQYPIPEVGEQHCALVLVLGFCGLRWGEVAA
jgi:integrase